MALSLAPLMILNLWEKIWYMDTSQGQKTVRKDRSSLIQVQFEVKECGLQWRQQLHLNQIFSDAFEKQ